MTDESRNNFDATATYAAAHDTGSSPDSAYDLGSDLGTPAWWRAATRLLAAVTVTCGLGVATPWLFAEMPSAHDRQAMQGAPFPLTLDVDEAQLMAQAEPLPVLRTALKTREDWRAPAGWQPHAALPAPAVASAELGAADAALAQEDLRTKKVAVRRGDTLIDVLTREGAAPADAHAAVEALRPIYNPKRLRIGQDVTLSFNRYETVADSDGRALVTVAIPTDVDRDVRVSRSDAGIFRAEEIVRPLEAGFLRATGTIDDSLFLAATKAGLPVETTLQLIRLFSYDVDFQRDLQPGDKFEVLYRAYYDGDGRAVKSGEVLCARLATKGKTFALYRYTTPDGDVDYFDADGRSNKKALMRTPIDGARISSGFGMRRHPVLGYSRMHKGLDFAAPTGTPIMAAGDGVVDFAGRRSGYGRYVKIRHFGAYATAYGHMSRIASKLRAGQRVKQGQIIGYVGQSGMATGPHLHYEVLAKGRQINPASSSVPINKTLSGKALASFQRTRAKIERQFAAAPSADTVARAD